MNILEQTRKKLKSAFIYIAIFSFIMNALSMVVPLYMLQIYDSVFSSNSLETLLYLTMITLGALVILSALEKTRSMMLNAISNWVDHQLSPEALRCSVDELIQGSIYPHQVLRDITSLRQFLCGQGMLALMDTPWLPIYLIVIYLMHPVLGFVGTMGAIIIFSLALLNEYVSRTPLQNANQKAAQTQFQIGLTLKNAETIQAMGMMPELVKHWFPNNIQALEWQSKASLRSGTVMAITKFVRMAIQVVMLGVGAFLVIHQHASGGIMIAATILLSKALSPVEQSIGAWSQLIQARNAYQKLKVYFQNAHDREAGIALPRPKGNLTSENLIYTIPNSTKPLLSNINFAINPGEILVLMGPSGSGKTTLARLMVGALKADQGSIRLDGADVFTWPREQFGKYVGYVPQNVELFPGTIKANIARMADGLDEDIIAAAQKANVHEMILKFPKGYETELIDAGARLSGGQRQRLALARALYGDPAFLVLDEPNASLDAEGEDALLKTLVAEKNQGKTIVLISHKANILNIADRVLLLRDGKVEIFMTRDEFVARLKAANQQMRQTI